jgi:hypothetical protein
LASQRFPALPHSHDIERVGPVSRGLHHSSIGCHTKNVSDVFADPFCRLEMVKLNLDRDVATNHVEAAREAQNRSQFSNSVTGEI